MKSEKGSREISRNEGNDWTVGRKNRDIQASQRKTIRENGQHRIKESEDSNNKKMGHINQYILRRKYRGSKTQPIGPIEMHTYNVR